MTTERSSSLSERIFAVFGLQLIDMLRRLGHWTLFVRSVLQWLLRSPRRWALLYKQCEVIGIQSIPIIALTGLFVGMVFALQTGKAFAMFNAETLVGATIGLSLTREIGPVFTSLMIVARVGSSMAAEIGSMRVSEQIDALETMAVNPIQYLVVPRVIAGTIMAPLLTALFNVVGSVGGAMVALGVLRIQPGPFYSKLYYYVDATDLYGGLFKAAVFGFLVSVISCYSGYTTKGGAKGVGLATTRAVVLSSVTVLIVDYFLTAWILEFINPATMK